MLLISFRCSRERQKHVFNGNIERRDNFQLRILISKIKITFTLEMEFRLKYSYRISFEF